MSKPLPDRLRVPNDGHAPWLLRRIWDRLNEQNEHFMGAIVGREGSGKSYTAIKIASEVDPSFTADRVIFDIADLLDVLRSGDHSPGDFYVLDESGVSLGRRTWQQRGQVLANQALQLIRSHNLGLIFTLPRLSELDSQTQGRLQAFLEITDKEDGEYVEGKWKFLNPDRTDRTGDIYRHFPRRRQDGKLLRITTFRFRPPSSDLTEPYEERKAEFQDRFYEETIGELRGDDQDDDQDGDEKTDLREVATEVANGDLGEYVLIHGGNKQPYISAELIQMDYDLSQNQAKTVKKLLERQYDTDDLSAEADTDTDTANPPTANSD